MAVGAFAANVGGFEIDANQALEGNAASQQKAYYAGNDVPPGTDWVGDSAPGGTDGVFYLDTDGNADFPDCYDSDLSIDPGIDGAATLICDGTSNSEFDAVENEENIVSPSGQTPDDEWPVSGGNNTPKNDITHGYILFRQGDSICDADAVADDLFAYIGAERLNHEGSAFWGVELNKVAPDGFDDLKNNTPLDFTLDHNRTSGDMLISINLTNGGEAAEITPFTLTSTPADGADANWVPAVSNCDPDGAGGNPPLVGPTQGATNTDGDVLAPPWNVLVCDPSETNNDNACRLVNAAGNGTEAGDTNVPERDFFEVVVDFTEFGVPQQCFGTALLTSRSSFPLESADLKDVAGGEVPLCAISVVKSGDTLSKVGDPAAYSITVTNDGVIPLFKDSIIDDVFGDLTTVNPDPATISNFVNGCGASLAPGASCTITFDYTVQAGDPDPLVNEVTIDYNTSGALTGESITDSDDHSLNLFQPAIDVDKTGDTLSKVGDSVDYVITLSNDSSADTPALTCTATDTLLGVVFGPAVLPLGDTVVNQSRTVLAGDPDPLVNTVTMNCSPAGFPNVLTDNDGHSVNLFQPAIDVDKTGDTLSKVGDSVDYVITLSNDSSADTPALTCTATDTLLGVVFGPAVLPLGDTVVNQSRTVLAGDPDPLVNTVTMNCSPAGFPNVLTDNDGHSVNLFQPAIDVDKTGDTLSKVGDPVNYVITLSNDSSADTPALTCTATDTLLGVVFGPAVLPPGDTVVNQSRTVLAGDPDPLVNTVTMNCSPAGFPNVLTDNDGHSVDLFGPAINILKTGPAFTKAGDVNDYTITLQNNSGPGTPALTCTATDDLLGVVFGPAVLPLGDTVVNRSRETVAGDPDPLVNTVSMSCSVAGFPNVLNDSASHSSDVLHPAFTVAKDCKANTEPVPQEGPAVFRVTFVNTGDANLVVNSGDGIGTFDLDIGETQGFDVSIDGPFSGQATVVNTVTGTVTLAANYGLDNSYEFSANGDCRVGSRVEVEKTVNGAIDSTVDLQFAIFDGPDGFDSGDPPLATDSTLGDADGVLKFGLENLDPTQTYTLCELNIPAGWTSVWEVNGADVTALVYNPDADNPVPEDLGNRCIEFGAGTTIPLTAGGTLRFVIDNQVPQGDARTPGYWKNWNECTGGRQAEVAEKNGGSAAGFWILEDLLPQTIGTLELTTCEDAVAILDSRDLNTNKKIANDAAYTLARALLAAQLNVGAGAAHSGDVDDAIAEANALLTAINFDGTGGFLGPKVKGAEATLRQQALSIAGFLDAYNNNLALPPYPGYFP